MELIEAKHGQDQIDKKDNLEKQNKIVMAAKINELEKELRPLR